MVASHRRVAKSKGSEKKEAKKPAIAEEVKTSAGNSREHDAPT